MLANHARARRPLALAMALIVAALAGAANGIQAAPALTATPWRLVSLEGVALTASERAGEATLILKPADGGGGQASGSSGCNRFFAGYRAHGDRLLFQRIGATKMACEGVRMRLEQRFFDVLARSARQQQRAGQLILLDSTGEELAGFEAATPGR